MDIYTSFHAHVHVYVHNIQVKSCAYFSSTVGKSCSYHSHEFMLYMDNMQGGRNQAIKLNGDQLNREARSRNTNPYKVEFEAPSGNVLNLY